MFRRPMFAALLALATTPALAQSDDPSFRVVNNTPNVVNNVYASPSSQQNWGEDRLSANEVIQPRGNRIIQLPRGECVFDIRIVYQGGLAEERRRLNTCNIRDLVLPMSAQEVPRGQQGAAPQQPQRPSQGQVPRGNPSFNLVNQGNRVIEEFYASLGTDSDWGADRLGNEVVQPGGRFAVRLPEGPCVYDLKVVFAGGGQPQERRGVNTCDLTDYVVR